MKIFIFSLMLLSANAFAADIHGCWYKKGFNGSDGYFMPDLLWCIKGGGDFEAASIDPGKLQKTIYQAKYTLNGNRLKISQALHYTDCPNGDEIDTSAGELLFNASNSALAVELESGASISFIRASEVVINRFENHNEGCN